MERTSLYVVTSFFTNEENQTLNTLICKAGTKFFLISNRCTDRIFSHLSITLSLVASRFHLLANTKPIIAADAITTFAKALIESDNLSVLTKQSTKMTP